MSWLLIALVAYFLGAIANIIDKTILKKDVSHPFIYVFYIALLGLVLLAIFLPFGFSFLPINTALLSLLAGVIFMTALLFMFGALQKDETTRIMTMIGGLTPVFVFIFAQIILKENLSSKQIAALALLIFGSLLMALDFQEQGGVWQWLKKKLGLAKNSVLPRLRRTLWLALPAALLFGLAHVLTKYIYLQTNFLNGFIWTRAGCLLLIVIMLFLPYYRQLIIDDWRQNRKKKQNKQAGFKFLFGQACGGGSTLLVQYAMFLGSVSLVQALQGLQYVFVFIIILLLTLFLPKILSEKITKEILFQKILAVLLIFLGLYFIAV